MLTAPAYTVIEDVTVFVDDLVWYKFYPLASYPSIRLDQNHHPVFQLVKYAFSDDDRQRNPNLPPGGGYINFDIQFDIAPDQLERVRARLQDMVNAQWKQFKNGTAEQQAKIGVAGTTEPPQVVFDTPTWTSGKVSLDAPQAKELVNARVAQGSPSLLTSNIAVFSMDLTSAGATYMHKTLVNPQGTGASDLTPIQVSYDLECWARLPPAHIHIKVDSRKVFDYLHQLMEGRGVDYCTTYDYQHTDIISNKESITGIIDVQIDNGSGSLSQAIITELQKYSLDLVKELIQAQFFSDQSPTASPDGGSPDKPPGGTSADTDPKKYLKKTYDEKTMHIELDLAASSVVEWPVHPQATLETFFKGVSASEMTRYVREIDLNDDFFKNLGLKVSVFTAYDEINAVEVDLHYEGKDETGRQVEKDQTLTFTSKEAQTWNPSLIGSTYEYQYRYRVGFKGRDFGPYNDWETTKKRELNIGLPSPGRVVMDIVTGDVDFTELLERIQVTVRYGDADLHIANEEHTSILTASKPEDHYERLIYAVPRQPRFYKTRFRLKSGEVLEDDIWHATTDLQLVVNAPFDAMLRVLLLPTGDGWDDVVQVIAEMRYTDPLHNYVVDESLTLKSRDELKTWKVVLREKTLRDFEYQLNISYKNRPFERIGWKKASDLVLPIQVNAPPRLKVTIMPDLLDFVASPITQVLLSYNGAGINKTEAFGFRDKTPQTFIVNLPADAPKDYTYQVTYHPVGHDAITLPVVHSNDPLLILTPYHTPKPGHLIVDVMAQLIDFDKTPLVEVNLKYDDDQNEVHEVASFAFDKKQTQRWDIEVKDTSHKLFGYSIVYYTSDGQMHPTDIKYQEIPRIIIPQFNASSASPH